MLLLLLLLLLLLGYPLNNSEIFILDNYNIKNNYKYEFNILLICKDIIIFGNNNNNNNNNEHTFNIKVDLIIKNKIETSSVYNTHNINDRLIIYFPFDISLISNYNNNNNNNNNSLITITVLDNFNNIYSCLKSNVYFTFASNSLSNNNNNNDYNNKYINDNNKNLKYNKLIKYNDNNNNYNTFHNEMSKLNRNYFPMLLNSLGLNNLAVEVGVGWLLL